MSTIEITVKKGSSLAKVLAAAQEQGWTVEQEVEGTVEYPTVKIQISAAEEAMRVHRINASFDGIDGRYYSATAYTSRSTSSGLTSERVIRDNKVKDILIYLAYGPIKRKAEADAKAAAAAAEESRKTEARTALDIASDTKEIESLKAGLASERERLVENLERSLKSIQGMAQRSLEDLEKGNYYSIGSHSGILYNGVVAEAERQAEALKGNAEMVKRIEYLFGPLPLTPRERYEAEHGKGSY